MTQQPHKTSTPASDTNIEELVQVLRRKQGGWVGWGKACQRLQEAGYSPQSLFEETGFEPIHQNQVIVGAQVYTTLVGAKASQTLLTHFEAKGSDILYEFRVLNQAERVAAATLAVEQGLDADEARDVAKAIREFSRLRHPPQAFTQAPGDRVAYRCWKLARQQENLQARSQFIARGLRFASSSSARQAIEQLLTDFTVTKTQPMPHLPVYRLESETELPRLMPCLGELPLTASALNEVTSVTPVGPFQRVLAQGDGEWVAIPGWQVVLKAQDPVAILCDRTLLPTTLPGPAEEELLVVVDRGQCQWDIHSHFAIAAEGQVQLQWLEQEPESPPLGRIILVLRPKQILDEDYTKELWQIDE